MQVSQGDLAGALASYRKALGIRETLAARDAGNTDWQSTPTMTSSFTYGDEGRMTGVTYPGYTGVNPASYTYTFDAMGRPSAMSSVASAGAYNAADQITSLAYLGGTETRTYNSLSQLTGVQLGTQTNVSYYYNAGTNNGQIATAVDTAHSQTINYSYDSLKRLSAAYNTSLNQPSTTQTTSEDSRRVAS